MVRRVMYASVVCAGLENDAALLRSILTVSVRNNVMVGVTGMLLRHGPHFIQALEGSALAVEGIFRKVTSDPRHRDLKILRDEDSPLRAFPIGRCAARISGRPTTRSCRCLD